jgi:hypothetical protein
LRGKREKEEAEREEEALAKKREELKAQRKELVAQQRKELAALDREILKLGGTVRRRGPAKTRRAGGGPTISSNSARSSPPSPRWRSARFGKRPRRPVSRPGTCRRRLPISSARAGWIRRGAGFMRHPDR